MSSLAYLQGPSRRISHSFFISLSLSQRWPAPECHNARHGVRIEFEITCCRGACPVIFVHRSPGPSWTSLPRYLTRRLVRTDYTVSSPGETARKPPTCQPCPARERPVMHQSSVILGLCSPSLGPHQAHPIIHTSPRFGWPAGRALNWCTAVAGCRSVTYNLPCWGGGGQLFGHCSSHLHPTSRRQIQSWPQISKLGCLIPAGQLPASDLVTGDEEES